MNLFRQKKSIQAEIIDTERMLELAKGHALMSGSLKVKLDNLYHQFDKLPDELTESKINLLFSGKAVDGSMGIKSSFVSKTVSPFQEMIKTQTALVRFGHVGKRGQAKSGANAELFITSLPVGSFGIELSQLRSNDLFAEIDVANAIKQIVKLIANTADSDELFEQSIDKTPKRNLVHLKKFLKEIVDENSFLKMETGEIGVEISEAKIEEAYSRVAATEDEEDEKFISGTLRGFLLDSGRFEIQDSSGETITGFISEDLSEEKIIAYDQLYLNKTCRIHLQIHKTKFKTGNEKTDYELLEIMNE